jgi:predicted nucleic acid-binding protein
VIISALLTPGGASEFILSEVESKDITSYYGEKIYDEYKEVFSRPKFPFEKKSADKLLDSVTRKFTRVIPETLNMPFKDESDRPFYETAMTANATLVTGNTKHYPDSPHVAIPSEFSRAYINLKLKHAALADEDNGPA